MSFLEVISDGLSRLDGWVNPFTKFGTSRDRTTAGSFQDEMQIPDPELSALFHQDDAASKIVSIFPEEMLRQGFEILADETKQAEHIKTICESLNLQRTFLDGMIWGRLWGGAAIFVGADDGQPADQPLRFDSISSVKFLQIYDRRRLIPDTRYEDPRHPKWNQPATFRITPIRGNGGRVAHESRLVIFRGAPTDEEVRERLNTWDLSILQRCYEPLRQFNTIYKAIELMVGGASEGVFKMKGLLAMIAGARQKDIQTRAQVLDMGRSIASSVFLDADSNESYDKVATQFAGLADLLDRAAYRLSAASGIPVTILMGMSPAGLNATGASDIRIFYDRVRTMQENDLKAPLVRVLRMIACSFKYDPAKIDVSFPPLWQETPKEKADRKKIIAETDQILVANEIATPEEIAIARYGGEDYSDELKIDPKLRIGSFLPPKAPTGFGGGPPPGQ